LRNDIANAARDTGLVLKRQFDGDKPQKRFIRFLDTKGNALRGNDLLLRQRVRPNDERTEYTLKCRSEDRYVSAGKNLTAATRFDATGKFEEDIGAPFVSKFSRSVTIVNGKKRATKNLPTTLSAAARMFPGLLDLRRPGRLCARRIRLHPVGDQRVLECVF